MQTPNIETLPVELIGTYAGQTDYFNQNFPAWEEEILNAYIQAGFNQLHWPRGHISVPATVHYCKLRGELKSPVVTNLTMNTTKPYTGPKVPEPVLKLFEQTFDQVPALFVVTKGEDWWPHEPAFLAHDANSYMMYCLYFCTSQRPELLTEASQPKKRGRPTDPAKAIEKQGRKERYQQWLENCSAYRAELLVLKNDYLEAKRVSNEKLRALQTFEAMGAPKWEG